MKEESPHPTKWILKGSPDPESIARRQEFLGALFETARNKGTEVNQLRQTSLNYALFIFAGLFTFSFQFAKGWYAVAGAAALCFTMCVFSVRDRQFHRFIHGWRFTEKHLTEKMTILLNQPVDDLEFRRYISEAEQTAEFWGLQPVITYALVSASAVHFAYCFWRSLTT